MRSLFKPVLFSLGAVVAVNAADILVTDASILPGQTVNWTKNNTYYLEGFVHVDSSAVLNIQAGTVIKGTGGYGISVSALIVDRNGIINAQGTAEEPIIFTSNTDDISDPHDLCIGARGMWGGVVIQGNGKMVTGTPGLPAGMMRIEGLPEVPEILNDPRNWAGGNNDADSSGVMKYVSIRHAGSAVTTGNELNGLSLYGVGSKTILEHIEVFCNDDDGIEFFGGAVNLKWASVAFVNDDSYDWDNGWDGKGQFWFAISAPSQTLMGFADRGLEASGTAKVENSDPLIGSNPTLYNFTFIGQGKNAVVPSGHINAIRFNESSMGKVHNGIIVDFPKKALQFHAGYAGLDSYEHFLNDSLKFTNCMFWDIGAGTTWSAIVNNTEAPVLAKVEANNWIKNPNIQFIHRSQNGWLDPRPNFTGSPACSTVYVKSVPSDPFFSPVTWVGAFNRTASNLNWLQGWSGLSSCNVLAKPLTITPDNYEFPRSGTDMDLTLILRVPPVEAGVVSTAACSVWVDGTNVSASFAARALGVPMTNGNGITFRINELQGWELGSVGIHTIRAAFPLTNGWVVRDTATYRTY